MIIADWVVLGAVLLFAIIGLAVGFGNGLKFFTSHIFGVIISIIVTYFLFGIVSGWGFVKDILSNFTNVLKNADNTFCDILLKIGIQQICLALAIFIIVQLLRFIIIKVIAGIFESNNGVIKVLNKILGIALFVAVALMLALITFQVIYWIGGSTRTNFANCLDGSALKLDEVFADNPLNAFINNIKLFNS